MTTSASRSTSPGRSSGMVDVRSMVRFGPAISKAARMSSGRVRKIARKDDLARLRGRRRGVERDKHAVVGREPLRELLDVLVARPRRRERAVLADLALGDA